MFLFRFSSVEKLLVYKKSMEGGSETLCMGLVACFQLRALNLVRTRGEEAAYKRGISLAFITI